MRLQDILKTLRNKNGYTQKEIATKLFISTQAVSKWENGSSVPSIDNLLALSDLYNISLDELVQGSPFFKKPLIVGNKYNFQKGLLFILIWLLISLMFTGFGYQPFWLFLLIFIIGTWLVFPTVFKDYWMIATDGLRIKTYSKNDFVKSIQLVCNNQATISLDYSAIDSVEIVYQTRRRLSPFDVNADAFYLRVSSQDHVYRLNLDASAKDVLPQFVTFLQRNHVNVIDDHHIVELLMTDQSLYTHFNQRQ